jgi:hypothetical protein
MTSNSTKPNSVIPMSAEDEALRKAEEEEWLANGKRNKFSLVARNDRNFLLSQTDWTQGKDIPDAISSKYTAYRQALRDVPQQAGFPDNIVWPTQPE